MITNVNVGDIIKMPLFSSDLYEGEIMDIDEDVLDSRMECKVLFDELNTITFFSKQTLINWANYLEDLKDE